MKEDMLKPQVLSPEETTLLREKFIIEYSKSRGWNPKDLSTIQMLEITGQTEYKNPGLILG